MKKLLKTLGIATLAAFLGLGVVACSSDDDDAPKSGPDGGTETALGNSFEFSGYKWKLNNATATEKDGVVTVTPTATGIVMQLDDSELAGLFEKYPAGFAVTAKVRPVSVATSSNAACFRKDGGKNIGVVANVTNTEFYGAFINFNGRTQLGCAANAKGTQFGSLLADPENKIFKQAIDEPYTIRLEVKEGDKISMYVNGIISNTAGTTEYSIPDGAKVTRSATVGSYGILSEFKDPLEVYSFKVEGLNEGKAAVLLQTTDSNFGTLSAGGEKYVFLNETAISPRIGDAAIEFTVSATNNAGEAADFSVVSSDTAIATPTKNAEGTGFTLAFIAAGDAIISVKNDSDENIVRKIKVNIKTALAQTDTEYTSMATAFYPQGEGVYEDEHLKITFNDVPVLVEGSVYIYDSATDELVDEIKIGSDTNDISDGSQHNNFVLKNFMVQVDKDSKTVEIIPHFGRLANNTEYYVVIGDGSITGKIGEQVFTGFTKADKRWKFKTREAKPSVTNAVRVGSSATADFRTVQAAIVAMADGATITVEKGLYREIIYNKSKSATIIGDTTTGYGADVIIQGINCNTYNGSSHTRAAFYWSGADLRMKNITIQNAYDRGVDGTSQSEAIYFANGAGKKLVAYNCSFLGQQDTIQTSGKNWFYKCHIEGDTDFIWGTADVALFEECDVEMINASTPSSYAALFETRVASKTDNLVPKGYVLYNSNLAANHSKDNYFARRTSGKSSTAYFDQAAVIDSKITGTISASIWNSSNEPEYLAKKDGNQHVGWKEYGNTGVTSLATEPDYAGTITQAVHDKEYNGRKTIMNRVYRVSSNAYENASDIWDLEEEATTLGFTATMDNSTLDAIATIEGANGTYDILALAKAATSADIVATLTDKDGKALADGTSSDTYVSWKNMLNFGAGYGCEVKNPTEGKEGKLTIKLAGKSVITYVSSMYSKGNVKVETEGGTVIYNGSAIVDGNTGNSSFIYEGTDPTTVTMTFSGGDNYIGNLTVSKWVDEVKSVKSVAISGGAAKISVGNDTTFTAVVDVDYHADTSVSWQSSNEEVATVENGKVTGVAAGTVTITATSAIDSTKKDTATVEVSADAVKAEVGKVYTWKLYGLASVPTTVSDVENTGLTISVNGTPSNNSGYGLYGNGISYDIPVAGDATIIAYKSYLGGTIKLKKGETEIDSYTVTSGDTKPANGPVPCALSYTGEATTLTLEVGDGIYLAAIQADNSPTLTAFAPATYDFTAEFAVPHVANSETDGTGNVSWMSVTDAGSYKDSNYGVQCVATNGPTYFTIPVYGPCKVTVYDSYDSGLSDKKVLFYGDGSDTAVGDGVAIPGDKNGKDAYAMEFSVEGNGAQVVSVSCPKNFYCSKITVTAE